MTIEDKQTLKSYFESGDTPTQAQFAILIDSLLGIEEEIADNLTTDSELQALSARQGVALKAIVDSMGLRVSSIEELNETTLGDYLLKADLGDYLATKSNIGHTHLASNITDLLDLVYSQEQVDQLIANYSVDSHTHPISDIGGLQEAIDGADNTLEINSLRTDLEGQIANKSDTDHAHTESDITDLKNYLESATATVLLQGKSNTGHTHSESQITDLDKYTKAEVDALFAGVVSDGSVPAHTHTEANISDLDKYTQAEVDQRIEDSKQTFLTSHLSESNPHGITKEDVGLGSVDNLSREEILTNPTISNPTFTGTITGLDGSAIGLPNVPNVNVLELLNSHLADTANPHQVELSDFDAFTRAETELRIQELLEIFRTVHVGDLPQTGTGSTGLVTQEDIWEKVKDISDPADGRQTLENSLDILGDITVQGKIEDTAGSLVIKAKDDEGSTVYNVNIQDELLVSNDTTIGGSGEGESADLTVYGTIRPNNTVKALTDDLILEGKDGNKVEVNDDLDVKGALTTNSGITATGGDLVLKGNTTGKVEIDDSLQINQGTTIGTTSVNADLTVNGDATITGNLTISGATTSIEAATLEIDDNLIILNKNQTGTPAAGTQSGVEIERGDKSNVKLYFDEDSGRWKAQMLRAPTTEELAVDPSLTEVVVTKTIAFVEDAFSQE